MNTLYGVLVSGPDTEKLVENQKEYLAPSEFAWVQDRRIAALGWATDEGRDRYFRLVSVGDWDVRELPFEVPV